MTEKQYLVIGAGRFGTSLAARLYQLGDEVVIIDQDEQAIEDVMHLVTHSVIADGTDEDALRKLGCSNFDVVVVAIGDDLEANILATVAAKSVGAKRVVSKAKSNTAARILLRVGADEVVRPEHDMGERLADRLATPNVLDALDLGNNLTVVEIEASDKLCGALCDLHLPRRFGLQVITINHDGDAVINPPAEYEIQKGDKLLLIGENKSVQKLRNYLS